MPPQPSYSEEPTEDFIQGCRINTYKALIEAALRGDINSSVRSTINKNLATNPFEDEGINLLSEKLIEKALHGKLSLKLLRMVGEYLAIKTLEENGFTNIRPTNQFQPSPNWNGQKKIQFGHVLATWKNRRYVIEIGTRKFTGKNYPFTWVHKSQVKEQVSDEIIDDENRAEEYYLRVKEFYKKAIPAWIAVSIDAREEDSVYSIFFGTAEKINWKLNCKISSSHTDISGKKNPDCFAKEKAANFIRRFWGLCMIYNINIRFFLRASVECRFQHIEFFFKRGN